MRAIFPILAAALALAPAYAADTDLAAEAQANLFAGRYAAAVESYSRLVKEDPGSGLAHDRLVRALIAAREPERAYAAAEVAAQAAPGTAPALDAQGRAAFRRGNLADAEKLFRRALAADPKYPDALVGLANIYAAVSKFRTAQDLTEKAFELNPRDPENRRSHADEEETPLHEAALQRALAALDPASDDARAIRAHLSRDAALHGRRRRLLSADQTARIKLSRLTNGPKGLIGLGLDVRFNDKTVIHLKLDSGASGMSLSPAAARRAGLEVLGDESTEARGLGDRTPDATFAYLAPRMRIGDLEWENYPVSVFRGAKEAEADGLIGTDVFSQFRVTIDFPGSLLSLDARAPELKTGEVSEAGPRPEGFTAIFRFGHLLTVGTSMNGGPNKLFLIDSGGTSNLVDIRAALDSTKVRQDDSVKLRGVQGEVKDVRSADKGTLVFAGFRQQNPDLIAVDMHGLSDSAGAEIAGIIGMPVLWHMKLTIDYASGSVRFERSAWDRQ
jgi:tetratricopeptide (TPR) repeat protein